MAKERSTSIYNIKPKAKDIHLQKWNYNEIENVPNHKMEASKP